MKQNTKKMNVRKIGYYQRVNGKIRLVTLYTTEELILKEMVSIKENKNSKSKVVSINLFYCITIQQFVSQQGKIKRYDNNNRKEINNEITKEIDEDTLEVKSSSVVKWEENLPMGFNSEERPVK